MTFLYDGVLHVYAETYTEADRQWRHLYDTETPCIIWKQGTDTPWAAFPMERLLKGAL